MSYDISLMIDTGGEERANVGNDHNYTYNCGPMFRKAIGGDGIYDLHDKPAGEVALILAAAVRDMRDPEKRAEYEAMNPPNGWGGHNSATAFLADLMTDCMRHPKATVRVS